MGDHLDNPIIRIITSPNLLLQNLTTREPDEKMIEVAITFLWKVIKIGRTTKNNFRIERDNVLKNLLEQELLKSHENQG